LIESPPGEERDKTLSQGVEKKVSIHTHVYASAAVSRSSQANPDT